MVGVGKRGGRRDERGFTLIEMIVVLAILGLMLGLVISHGPAHSQRLDLDTSAQEIARSLRLARSRAIAQNRMVRWVPTPRGYSLDGAATRALPADVTMTEAGTIGFAADGSSSGGLITLRGGERQIAIALDWLTGRVAIAEGSRIVR
jgi:general secretion pathway protein H